MPHRRRQHRVAAHQPDSVAREMHNPGPGPQPDPDHAGKALGLVNEWIRHSDAKAGVTLAFTGALGTMTFNLTKDFTSRTLFFDVLAAIAYAPLVITAILCGWTQTSRISDKDSDRDATNRLFFASIAQNFKGQRQQYSDVLRTLPQIH